MSSMQMPWLLTMQMSWLLTMQMSWLQTQQMSWLQTLHHAPTAGMLLQQQGCSCRSRDAPAAAVTLLRPAQPSQSHGKQPARASQIWTRNPNPGFFREMSGMSMGSFLAYWGFVLELGGMGGGA